MAANVFEKEHLRDRAGVFRNRGHGGMILGEMVNAHYGSDTLVFAIPAGGVPVAERVAEQLSTTLDLCVVSKITLPWNSEAGYGAVAFDGTVRLNSEMLPHLKILPGEVEKGILETKRKVIKRVNLLRGSNPFPDLSNRPAIIVDDGLASGFTMHVAAVAMKNQGASRIVIAVPTGHEESVFRLAKEVTSLYCPNIRGGWSFAVADAYESWTDVTEEEALEILGRFRETGYGRRE